MLKLREWAKNTLWCLKAHVHNHSALPFYLSWGGKSEKTKEKQETPTAQLFWKVLKTFSLHLLTSKGTSQAKEG